MKFGFFKAPKPQRFDYKPRYYDPRKEQLEERVKRIQAMKEDNPEAAKARIQAGLRRGWSSDNASIRKKAMFRSNMILLFVVGALIVLTYGFLTIYLPQIVKMVE